MYFIRKPFLTFVYLFSNMKLCILFSTFTLVLLPQVKSEACPDQWIMHGSSCYWFHTDSRSSTNWEQSIGYCRSNHSNLVIVDSSEENQFLASELSKRIHTGSSDVETAVWIGATDEHHEGKWFWQNDLDHATYMYPVAYTHWTTGQPDNHQHSDCIALVGRQGYTWADFQCKTDLYYICERSVTYPTVAPNQQGLLGCENGWTPYGKSCYYFNDQTRNSWGHAEAYCTKHQSHLVIVETSAENDFLIQEMSRIDLKSVWTAGNDDTQEGHWVWSNTQTNVNTAMSAQFFQFWKTGEPDSGGGDHDEDCMCFIGDDHFKWNDYACSEHMFFVCEKDRPNSVLTTPSSVISQPHGCPLGWVLHASSCYMFSVSRRDWSEANTYCYQKHSHLAIIQDSDEDQFLGNELRQRVAVQHVHHTSDTGVWIAGSDNDVEGIWEWTDLISHRYEPVMGQGYENWYPGEPDSGGNSHDEDCMSLIGKYGFQWQDHKCSESMFFVCEKPVSNGPILVG